MASHQFPGPGGSGNDPDGHFHSFAAPILGPAGGAIEEIGINRPLTVELAYVSTAGSGSWGRHDLLVASTVKNLPVFNAAPRAVNAVVPSLQDGLARRFDGLPANLNATPVIYHSPGQVDRGVVVTVEMVWNSFDNDLVQSIGGLLASSAGVPLFAPAAGYLMAGSVLLKAAGNLLERIVDGRAFFEDTLTLSLNRPGMPPTPASYHLMYGNSVAIDKLVRADQVKFDPDRGLVNKSDGEPAAVADPYAVVLVYGNARPDYAKFAPTMASAAILEKFFHAGAADRPVTSEILDLLKSVNDVSYRNRASGLLAQARGLNKQAPDYPAQLAAIQAEFEAANKNVQADGLRIKWEV